VKPKLIPAIFIRLLSLTTAGLSVGRAAANGFALPDQDAFATARGEAVVATADNPSAVYYNPAGITQMGGHNLRAGFYALEYQTSFQPPKSQKNFDAQSTLATIPRFFYSFSPTNLPLSFGLGIYSPFGGNMRWPQDTGFRSVAIEGKLTYITINPVVAWKISPALSLAAGPMVNFVNLQTDQGLRRFPNPPNNYRFNGSGWSTGYNLGARWQPLDQLSFGATYRSSAKVAVDGHTDFEWQPYISRSGRTANMNLIFPMSAVGGVSYHPTPKWNMEFDASYSDWSSFGSTRIHQANPPFPLQPIVPVALDWQSSWMYEFGITRYFENHWNVSGGYCFSGNSVPNSHYTPLAADMDRHFFSLGTGYQGQHLSFDLAYQIGYGPTHTVTGSTPSSTPGQVAGQNGDGKYNFYCNAISASIGWHF
jgi:long-chain fatty acid transport protein